MAISAIYADTIGIRSVSSVCFIGFFVSHDVLSIPPNHTRPDREKWKFLCSRCDCRLLSYLTHIERDNVR